MATAILAPDAWDTHLTITRSGPRTLCNACGLRVRRRRKAHKATRIVVNPAYKKPAASAASAGASGDDPSHRMSVDFLVS